MLIVERFMMVRPVERDETLSSLIPALRHRMLRVLLIAAPGITAAVAILTSTESNLVLAIVLNLAAGIIISSTIFIAVSIISRRAADERVDLAHAADEGVWRARAQRFSICNDETGLYADWYFRLRLQEEVERSRRYDLRFAVLLVKPLGLGTQPQMASTWFGDNIRRHLRKSDLPALLQDGSLGVIMSSSARRAARTVRRRIAGELEQRDPRIGLACFPDDGQDPEALLKAAAQAAAATAKRSAA